MLKKQFRSRHSSACTALCAGLLTLLFLSTKSAYADPTNTAFVQKAFQDLLLRPASPADISLWAAPLDAATITRTQFALDVMNSDEYRRVRVNEFFNDYLSRTPNSPDFSFYVPFLQTHTLPQTRASILGSGEYFSTQSGSTNAGFLNALYQDLLSRPIDSAASNFFQVQLIGGATRSDIATTVQGSDEFRGDIVSDYYQQFLHHAPDSTGLNLYKNLLGSGASEQEVIADILGSPEYFQNVPEPTTLLLLGIPFFSLAARRRRALNS